MKLGIISAFNEELNLILDDLQIKNKTHVGSRSFYEGNLYGQEVIIVFCRYGKVAATITATCLIERFGVDAIIFTGVAGGIERNAHIGDVVVGNHFIQHDFDASPIFPRYEIPLTPKEGLRSDVRLTQMLTESVRQFIHSYADFISEDLVNEFHLHSPQMYIGAIATGDQFIKEQSTKDRITSAFPDVVCVEMENGAVAQVCNDFEIPFAAVRTISDSANEDAHVDFTAFCERIASKYSLGIIRNFISILRKEV